MASTPIYFSRRAKATGSANRLLGSDGRDEAIPFVGRFLRVGRCDKLMTNSRLLADTLAKDLAIALRQRRYVLHADSDCGANARTCGIEE
jgi:hypothetical protein